ncbi:MAG: sugar ABC transporter permease, partial [Clostridia bacterium]|nr:sugar ABC transporter permease [Clostridia bacterium]
MQKAQSKKVVKQGTLGSRISRDLRKNKYKYLMVLPVLIWYILFCYKPMYGILIAFKNYTPSLGIMGSEWVGLKHFI